MSKQLIILLTLLLTGCMAYEQPKNKYVTLPEPPVKNAVESIPQASEVLVTQLLSRNSIKDRIRVALMPIENRYLDPGVSVAITNGILDELVSRNTFDMMKDLDIRTIRKALSIEDSVPGFWDTDSIRRVGHYLRADAVLTCTVSDSIQYWQIHVDLTPIDSNVIATSATCYLPKRAAMASQIYR